MIHIMNIMNAIDKVTQVKP